MFYPDETTAHVLFFALAIVTSTAMGLVVVWSAMCSHHWFLRVASIEAVLLLNVTIAAFDLVLVYFVQALVVYVALHVAAGLSVDRSTPTAEASRTEWLKRLTSVRFTLRLTKGHFSKPQFFLSDALLSILVVAVVLP